MVMPVIAGGQRFFYWNLSANVGLKSPNRIDDVQLVQLGYVIASEYSGYDASLRNIFKQVIPGASYTASDADPLTKAIQAHQIQIGGSPDGHVSVVTNFLTGQYQQRGNHTFVLISLVNGMSATMPEYYPRIDKHPKCPPALKAAVRACSIFGGPP